MPMTEKDFLELIKSEGCTVEPTARGHYKILDEKGHMLSGYAKTHGKRTKRNEIKDCYVRAFKRALELKHQQQS